jgi:hypothetical protein
MKIIKTKSVVIEGIDLEKFEFQTKKNEKEYFKMMEIGRASWRERV